jgi:hypothetical protein
MQIRPFCAPQLVGTGIPSAKLSVVLAVSGHGGRRLPQCLPAGTEVRVSGWHADRLGG